MTSSDSFDLSFSDNSAIMNQPFSLLTRVDPHVSTPTRSKASTSEPHEHYDEENVENTVHETEVDDRRQAAKLREEKLQSDIFILKKLNAAFESFNDALQETGSANEVRSPSNSTVLSAFQRYYGLQRVAAQVEQTDALLNKYIGILSKSEEFARLIFDDQWEGVQAVSLMCFDDAIFFSYSTLGRRIFGERKIGSYRKSSQRGRRRSASETGRTGKA